MQNLNKEHFWNGIYEEYPKATQEFCDFIDRYKEENNWVEIFGSKIKYHDLPIEMQVGIWMAFEIEQGVEEFTVDNSVFTVESMYEWISENLREREINITNDNP